MKRKKFKAWSRRISGVAEVDKPKVEFEWPLLVGLFDRRKWESFTEGSRTISGLMVWHKTPQGFNFWSNIYREAPYYSELPEHIRFYLEDSAIASGYHERTGR